MMIAFIRLLYTIVCKTAFLLDDDRAYDSELTIFTMYVLIHIIHVVHLPCRLPHCRIEVSFCTLFASRYVLGAMQPVFGPCRVREITVEYGIDNPLSGTTRKLVPHARCVRIPCHVLSREH